MTKELDLHGVKHYDVDRLVENFVLLNEPPLTIITGNSQQMKQIVINTLMILEIDFEVWGSGCYKIF